MSLEPKKPRLARLRVLSQPPAVDELQTEELRKLLEHSEQEARMILPGIQALFGFQLIAVFNAGFQKLSPTEQHLHLFAIVCVVLAATLTITPAAYHRQAEPAGVSGYHVRIASWLLMLGLLPLAVGICLDFYLISRLITGIRLLSGILAILLFAMMSGFWFVFPEYRRREYRDMPET